MQRASGVGRGASPRRAQQSDQSPRGVGIPPMRGADIQSGSTRQRLGWLKIRGLYRIQETHQTRF